MYTKTGINYIITIILKGIMVLIFTIPEAIAKMQPKSIIRPRATLEALSLPEAAEVLPEAAEVLPEAAEALPSASAIL